MLGPLWSYEANPRAAVRKIRKFQDKNVKSKFVFGKFQRINWENFFGYGNLEEIKRKNWENFNAEMKKIFRGKTWSGNWGKNSVRFHRKILGKFWCKSE